MPTRFPLRVLLRLPGPFLSGFTGFFVNFSSLMSGPSITCLWIAIRAIPQRGLDQKRTLSNFAHLKLSEKVINKLPLTSPRMRNFQTRRRRSIRAWHQYILIGGWINTISYLIWYCRARGQWFTCGYPDSCGCRTDGRNEQRHRSTSFEIALHDLVSRMAGITRAFCNFHCLTS